MFLKMHHFSRPVSDRRKANVSVISRICSVSDNKCLAARSKTLKIDEARNQWVVNGVNGIRRGVIM